MRITAVLMAQETSSVGDAMRDIYTRKLITSDFILAYADSITNARIEEAVQVYKDRRKTNKSAIMTMLLKETGAVHRTRCVPRLFLLRSLFKYCIILPPAMKASGRYFAVCV